MSRLLISMSCCLLVAGSCVDAQDAAKLVVEDAGVIRHVTLYRDRALVTREIQVPAGDGLRSINVPNLPESVDPESVYADGLEGAVVQGVRVSPREDAGSNREDVRRLQQQLDDLNGQRASLQHNLTVANRNIKLLDQLVQFSAVSQQSDLNRGVLDANALTTLATFSIDKHRELAAAQFEQQQQLAALDQQIQEVTSRRNQITSRPQSPNFQASIFVATEAGRAGTVRLSYSVAGCGWSPQYTVRGHTGQRTITVRYSASIQQVSGEDWHDVGLMLSTASAAASATRPILTPLRVTSVAPTGGTDNANQESRSDDLFDDPFAAPPHDSPVPMDSQSHMRAVIREQQRQTESSVALGQFALSPEQRDVALNALAGQLQQIELQAESKSLRALAPDVDDDIATQVYTLPQPVSLDTRREQQLVQILQTELEGELYYVATPLLSTYAYREAELTNAQPVGLLAGPAKIHLDDRFVGRTEIASTASGQRLTIGFGADQQVRTRRELLDKQDAIQGGNRHLRFTYRLVVANYKNEPVAVRLMDRLPEAPESQQLAVRLEDPQQPLSGDGLYRRVLQPTGILRWDLSVPAGRHGSQAFDVHYSYTMEFDRGRVPTTHPSPSAMPADRQDVNYGSGGGSGGSGGFGGGGSFGGGTGGTN